MSSHGHFSLAVTVLKKSGGAILFSKMKDMMTFEECVSLMNKKIYADAPINNLECWQEKVLIR